MDQSPVVTGLRKQYPGYNDIPDSDFVTAVHDAHYKDMPEEDFYKAMDDAYSPKPAMQPQTHWAGNVLHALGDAAKSLPGEVWKDATGLGSGIGTGLGAHTLEDTAQLPTETPAALRARGFQPKQVLAVLKGNSDIQQQETGALLDASKKATSDTARGAAFAATLPIGGEAMFGKGAVFAAVKNPLVRHAIAGALGVGTYQAARTGLEEGSLDNVPKAGLEGAAMGAVAGPIMHTALGAVGRVLQAPFKAFGNTVLDAGARKAAQTTAAGVAATKTFMETWADKFNGDMLRNMPDLHQALLSGKATPQETAQRVVQRVFFNDAPGGNMNPDAWAPLEQKVSAKIAKWGLAQPGFRIGLRNPLAAEFPAADIGGNTVPNNVAPEPNVLGQTNLSPTQDMSNMTTAPNPVEPNAQTLPAGPGNAMLQTEGNVPPGMTGGSAPDPNQVTLPEGASAPQAPVTPMAVEPSAPPAPTPFTPEGAALPPETPLPFNTPPELGQPLGINPALATEPNPATALGGDLQGAGQAVAPGTPPGSPLNLPPQLGGLTPISGEAQAAGAAPTLEPNAQAPTGAAGIEPNTVPGTLSPAGTQAQAGSLAAVLQEPSGTQGKWREFVDTIGPGSGADISAAIESNASPVTEELTKTPPAPAPGRWHQVDMFADANIAAAKQRMNKRGVRLNAFIDPADVADASIIGANYMLKGATSFADWSEKMLKEFGETVKPHLQRLYGEAKAAFDNRRPIGNDDVRRVATDYVANIGLGPGQTHGYQMLNTDIATKIAKAYDALPLTAKEGSPAYRAAVNSYKALVQEIEEQYQHMVDSGVKVEFVTDDPYPNSSAMMKDVRTNNRLRVFASQEGHHPFLTADQTNQFRAVHDYFGHAAEGYEFGPRGEDNAWRKHAAMFSDDAIPAMSTETRGQSSWVNFGPHRDLLPSERPFAPQKFGVLPDWVWEDAIKARKRDAARLASGVTKAGEGTTSIDDVAKAVTKGVKLTTNPKSQVARALADGSVGIPEWNTRNPGSKGWYSHSIDDMMHQTETEFPTLQDNPGKQGLFKLMLAVSSMGRKPTQNYDYATRMFAQYEKTGKLPLLGRTGQELGLFGRSAAPKFNDLVKQFAGNEQGMVDFLTSQDAKGRYNSVNIFGPKIGRFYLNLFGIHGEVTVDRWMTRWWNRVTGVRTVEDAPSEDTRKLITDSITTLAAQNGIAPDEAQAILWDREKRTWRDAGLVDPGDLDFAQAAKLIIANRRASLGKAATSFAAQGVTSGTQKAAMTPALEAEADIATKFLKKKYPVVSPSNLEDGIRSQSLWVAPDGSAVLVPEHQYASSAALRALRLGEKKVGYEGGYRWDNHGLLQRGFIRVQNSGHQFNMEAVQNATNAQRQAITKMSRGKTFLGVLGNFKGTNEAPHLNTWGDMRRAMDAATGD